MDKDRSGLGFSGSSRQELVEVWHYLCIDKTELSLMYKRYNCTVLISLPMNQAGANYDIIHVLLEANKFMPWQNVNMQ